MPVPLDLRLWRCRCQGEKIVYVSPSAADVRAVLPDVHHIRLPKDCAVPRAELPTRPSKVIGDLHSLANIVGAIGRSSADLLPDSQGILQRFFDPGARPCTYPKFVFRLWKCSVISIR